MEPLPDDKSQSGPPQVQLDLGVALEILPEVASALFDRAESAILIFDRNGTVLRSNPACQKITGFSPEEIVGTCYLDGMIPPDLIEESREKLNRILSDKQTIHCETRWMRKDGSQAILKGTFSVILNSDGEIQYVVGIGIDVSAERDSQRALLESQQRFELAVEGAQDGIWDYDYERGTVYFSPRWKEIIGYKPQELVDSLQTWIENAHPDDRERVQLYLDAYHRHPERKNEIEFRMKHKDGSWRWVISRGKAVTNAQGQIVRIAGSHKDITQRKLSESALRENEMRLREAQDIADLGTWDLDLKSNSVWWSPQTYRIYGIPSSQNPPSMDRLLDTVHPQDKERVKESIRNSLATGEPYRVKRRIIRPTGEIRHIVTSARILYDAEGSQSRVVGVVQDITEQQIAEDAILMAREQALEASRLKSEFLANMSHEIRTPMNGVIGMADMLLDSILDHEQRKWAYTIRTSAEGLMTILNDILDFSKIEAGKLTLEDAPVDVLELVEEAATIISRSAQEKSLDLIIDADWSASTTYLGDSTRIRQILTNLATNAVKFTKQGSVALGLRTSDEGVQLWVEDTGMGIAEERHRAIFDSFTQADGSTTRRYGGTGLGLAIVRQLVDLMKGSVALISEPSVGSRFDVFLPLEPTKADRAPNQLASLNVLLVTRSERVMGRAKNFFTGLGASFRSTHDILEIEEILNEGVPISVLVDDESEGRNDWGDLRSVSNHDWVNLVLLSQGSMAPPPGFDGTLTLPFTRRTVEHVLASDSNYESAETLAKTPIFSGMSALLAEDNLVNQTVAEHQLERMGFRIESVTNGRDAVNIALKERFDVILMDVQMPEMDGLTATGMIRRNQREEDRTVILAMTAHAMQGDRERCLDAGMDDYISKPVRASELLEKLSQWLKPDSSQASRLNWEYLHDMSNGDFTFEKELLAVYLHTMPELMKQLTNAIRHQSYVQMSRLSHTLKGSSRSIGANQFADLCQEVESLAEASQPYRHVDRLEHQFADLIEECQHYVES